MKLYIKKNQKSLKDLFIYDTENTINNNIYLQNPFLIPHLPLKKNLCKINNYEINVNNFKEEIKLFDKKWTIKDNYSNKWKSVCLKGINGEDQNYLEPNIFNQNENIFKYTKNIEYFPNIKRFLSTLNTDIYLVRLLKLESHGIIKYHTDEIVFKNNLNIIRCHLPIITNSEVIFKIGIPLQKPKPGYSIWNADTIMEKYLYPGYLWYTNVNCLHSVENNSSSDRIHLVIDLRPTAEILKKINSIK